VPGNPQSWNRYAYVNGDPANHADPSGLDLTAQDCIIDPDACLAADGGQQGNDGLCGDGLPCGFGYGTVCGVLDPGGPICVGPSSGSGFYPSPPTPSPCPPPPPPPTQLECGVGAFASQPAQKFSDVSSQNHPAGPGYFIPTFISFDATGGSGSYVFAENQIFNVSGLIWYHNGAVTIANNSGTDFPLSTAFTAPGTVTYSDSPGIWAIGQGSFVTNAIVQWSFALSAVVVDPITDQIADCPTVNWNAILLVWTENGTVHFSGSSWSSGYPQ